MPYKNDSEATSIIIFTIVTITMKDENDQKQNFVRKKVDFYVLLYDNILQWMLKNITETTMMLRGMKNYHLLTNIWFYSTAISCNILKISGDLIKYTMQSKIKDWKLSEADEETKMILNRTHPAKGKR